VQAEVRTRRQLATAHARTRMAGEVSGVRDGAEEQYGVGRTLAVHEQRQETVGVHSMWQHSGLTSQPEETREDGLVP